MSRLPALLLACLVSVPAARASGEINIYSYRQDFLIKPMLEAFTNSTGIKINTVHAQTGMVERLKREGARSPADIVLTVDIGRLTDLERNALTQPVSSAVLNANVPANYRDPNGNWFGLTARARIIVTSKERLAPDAITTYEALAEPAFAGKICTRSGKHAYMVALTASMMAHHGAEAAEKWLRGVKANLARKPQGNDRAQVRAIKEGVCDIAVINHYYIGNMMADAEQRPWADAVRVIFPNQAGRGTHMNVSGIALTTSAPNRANAVKLMEFLSSADAQRMYAELNSEYPVLPGVPRSDFLNSLGEFKTDDLDLARIAALRSDASKLADVVDYDGG